MCMMGLNLIHVSKMTPGIRLHPKLLLSVNTPDDVYVDMYIYTLLDMYIYTLLYST